MSGRPQNKPSAEPSKAPPEATTPAPDTVPTVPAAELDALRAAHAEELEQVRAAHAKELRALRERFDRAQQERDAADAERVRRMEEAAAPLALPEGAPVAGTMRVFRARHGLRLTGPDGRRVRINPGEAIPEGCDLTGLAADAYEEG